MKATKESVAKQFNISEHQALAVLTIAGLNVYIGKTDSTMDSKVLTGITSSLLQGIANNDNALRDRLVSALDFCLRDLCDSLKEMVVELKGAVEEFKKQIEGGGEFTNGVPMDKEWHL